MWRSDQPLGVIDTIREHHLLHLVELPCLLNLKEGCCDEMFHLLILYVLNTCALDRFTKELFWNLKKFQVFSMLFG